MEKPAISLQNIHLSVSIPIALHRRLMGNPAVKEAMRIGRPALDRAISEVIAEALDEREFPRRQRATVADNPKALTCHHCHLRAEPVWDGNRMVCSGCEANADVPDNT